MDVVSMGIMVGIGDVGDCVRHIVHGCSLFDIDDWCGNMSVNRFGLLVLQSC